MHGIIVSFRGSTEYTRPCWADAIDESSKAAPGRMIDGENEWRIQKPISVHDIRSYKWLERFKNPFISQIFSWSIDLICTRDEHNTYDVYNLDKKLNK